MSLPISTMSPRPILKRSPRKAEHIVHFPPSPVLTRMALAHSPSSYDRSPIIVERNSCALPARGCPGRTYALCDVEDEEEEGRFLDRYDLGPDTMLGRDLHPRAMLNTKPRFAEDSSQSSHPTYPTSSTSSHLTTPPLTHDSSSSETEDSDGLTSPPQELFSAFLTSAPPASVFGSATFPLGRDSDDDEAINPAFSFLPYPLDDVPRKTRDSKTRIHLSREKTVTDQMDCDELDRAFARSSLLASLSSCNLSDGDEGCLAGF
jgi:hypothetical protein